MFAFLQATTHTANVTAFSFSSSLTTPLSFTRFQPVAPAHRAVPQILATTEEKTETSPKTVNEKSTGPAATEAKEVPFEIRGFSLANVGVLLGFIITANSFYSYFSTVGTSGTSSIGFVYGIPILLAGLALKYAELKPVPLETSPYLIELREKKANETQKKIIADTTRHRYGDDAHMGEALKVLGLVPKGYGHPELVNLKEYATPEGQYGLDMTFFSRETPYDAWEKASPKFPTFFGPNVRCELQKVDAQKRLVKLSIITL